MKKICIMLIFLSVLFLCGCEMRTVDQMYAPPKRSDDYYSLQTLINESMGGMSYSAPISGDNQQIVQAADLNGDEIPEYLLYAKGGEGLPLHILIFSMVDDAYVHTQTIDLPGSSFDKVEYAPIDGEPGMEIVVGTQVSDQVSRSVCVYSFATGEAVQLVTEDYIRFLTVDLNENKRSELFVLRSGSNDTDCGIVEIFSLRSGVMQRSIELTMSEPASSLKRILVGNLEGGMPAVYVASAMDKNTLVTDVYTIIDGVFTNVSLSAEAGTSVKTIRNYFVYADDIDTDECMELPGLIEMRSIDKTWYGYDQKLIRWYSLTPAGEEVNKMYTYHNFIGGWYMQLPDEIAESVSVVDLGTSCDFYIWDGDIPVKVMSVYSLSGQSRQTQSALENRIVLYKDESTVFAAELTSDAQRFGFTEQLVVRNFHIIHEHWNTGET